MLHVVKNMRRVLVLELVIERESKVFQRNLSRLRISCRCTRDLPDFFYYRHIVCQELVSDRGKEPHDRVLRSRNRECFVFDSLCGKFLRIEQILGIDVIAIILIVRDASTLWRGNVRPDTRDTKRATFLRDISPSRIDTFAQINIRRLFLWAVPAFDALT